MDFLPPGTAILYTRSDLLSTIAFVFVVGVILSGWGNCQGPTREAVRVLPGKLSGSRVPADLSVWKVARVLGTGQPVRVRLFLKI